MSDGTFKTKWFHLPATRRLIAEANETVKAHHDDAATARGEVQLQKFELERERDLHNITKNELVMTREQLADAINIAARDVRAELEDEFTRAATQRQQALDLEGGLRTRLKAAEAVAHNAIENAAVRLHAEFGKRANEFCDTRVLGTIPVFSVATSEGGGRVLVDPDGPLMRAILLKTVELMKGLDFTPKPDRVVPDAPTDEALDTLREALVDAAKRDRDRTPQK